MSKNYRLPIAYVIMLSILSSFCISSANAEGIVKINRYESTMTLTGSSGYINVPTATVSNGFNLVSYFGFNSTKNGSGNAMIRTGVGLFKFLEIFMGVDANMYDKRPGSNIPPTALVGVKFTIFKLSDLIENYFTNLSLGLQSTFIFNNIGDDVSNNISNMGKYFTSYQIMGMVTWTLPFIDFTLSLGKSFDPDSKISFKDPKTMDIGLGARLWIYDQGGMFALSGVVDYSNFSYNVDGQFQETMHNDKMRFSAAIRFAFLRKMILFTVGANDLFRESNPLVFFNLGISLSL